MTRDAAPGSQWMPNTPCAIGKNVHTVTQHDEIDDSSCNCVMEPISIVEQASALLYDEAPVRLKPFRNSSVTAWNWRLIGLGLKSG